MEKLKKKIKNFGDFIHRYLVLKKEKKNKAENIFLHTFLTSMHNTYYA